MQLDYRDPETGAVETLEAVAHFETGRDETYVEFADGSERELQTTAIYGGSA